MMTEKKSGQGMKKVYQTIISRRTIRKFQQKAISDELLISFIKAASLAPSAANLQPCEYLYCNASAENDRLFPALKWAGYIRPHGDPGPDEKPAAYIIVLTNEEIKSSNAPIDAAAGMMNMILAAWEEGIGSCWLGAIDRARIKEIFQIPEHVTVFGVLALGYPLETPVIEPFDKTLKYWKDSQGTLHVPKRNIINICFKNRYGQSGR
jgi:nitroreductase